MDRAHFLGDVVGDLMELHIVSGIEFLVDKNRVRKWHTQGVAAKFESDERIDESQKQSTEFGIDLEA